MILQSGWLSKNCWVIWWLDNNFHHPHALQRSMALQVASKTSRFHCQGCLGHVAVTSGATGKSNPTEMAFQSVVWYIHYVKSTQLTNMFRWVQTIGQYIDGKLLLPCMVDSFIRWVSQFSTRVQYSICLMFFQCLFLICVLLFFNAILVHVDFIGTSKTVQSVVVRFQNIVRHARVPIVTFQTKERSGVGYHELSVRSVCPYNFRFPCCLVHKFSWLNLFCHVFCGSSTILHVETHQATRFDVARTLRSTSQCPLSIVLPLFSAGSWSC